MNSVYFSNEGMTSTSANYYANIAKELQNAATERLNNVKFFDTSVAVIGSNDKQLMSAGVKTLDFIPTDLTSVASLNAFCAWVREAIKEKEAQQRAVNTKSMEMWAFENGYEFPTLDSAPKDPKPITEQDVIDTWDINKRNKYLSLEAFAATYGKYIHVDGAFSNARKKAHIAINNPIVKEGTGRDMILYYTTESVDIAEVDELFLQLQDQYRSYEKELNQMKAELKETVANLTREAYDKHQVLLDEWTEKRRAYNAALTELRNKFVIWKTTELERISKLKITVPKHLMATFEKVKKAGDSSK